MSADRAEGLSTMGQKKRTKRREQERRRGLPRGGVILAIPAFLGGLGLAVAIFRNPPGAPRGDRPPSGASESREATPYRPTSSTYRTSRLPAELANDSDLLLAEEALRAGRADEATERLEAAHRRYPEYPEPLLALASIYLKTNQIQKALVVSQRAVQVAPRDADCHLSLGEALEAQGERDRAERSYLEAANLARRDPRPFYRLARIAEARGHTEVAMTQYRRALEADPSYPPAAHYMASRLSDSGEFDEAVRLLNRAVRREPTNTSLRLNLAHIYLRKGDAASAAGEFRRALRDVPQMAEPHYFLGRALELLGQEREALDALQKALKLDPHLHMAWYALGQLERRRGNEEEAATAFRRFERARELKTRISQIRSHLGKHPRDVGALVDLGRALLARGKPAEAATSLTRALELAPGHPEAAKLLSEARMAP